MKSMRYYHKTYMNSRVYCIFILTILFLPSLNAHSIREKAGESIQINLKVVDEDGNPIANAEVLIGAHKVAVNSEELGSYSFGVNPGDQVTLSAPGFEKRVSSGKDIIRDQKITLERSDLYREPEDNIPLPYLSVKKRHATGSYNVI